MAREADLVRLEIELRRIADALEILVGLLEDGRIPVKEKE